MGAHIAWSPEPPGALETAGGIAKALPLLGDDPFLVVNGDIWCDWDFQRARGLTDRPAHLVMMDNPTHHAGGDFRLDGEQLRLADGGPTLTYCGIGVFAPAFFADVPSGAAMKLRLLLDAAIPRGIVTGVTGTPRVAGSTSVRRNDSPPSTVSSPPNDTLAIRRSPPTARRPDRQWRRHRSDGPERVRATVTRTTLPLRQLLLVLTGFPEPEAVLVVLGATGRNASSSVARRTRSAKYGTVIATDLTVARPSASMPPIRSANSTSDCRNSLPIAVRCGIRWATTAIGMRASPPPSMRCAPRAVPASAHRARSATCAPCSTPCA